MTFKQIYDFKNKFDELTDELMSYTQFINFLHISTTVLNRINENSKFMCEFFKMFSANGSLSRFDFLLIISILKNKVPTYSLKEFITDFLKIDCIFDGLDDTYLLCIYDKNKMKISNFKKRICECDLDFLLNIFYIELN